jgi:precorrin-6Y C5,15-methyltransferase (decarboxylating)
MAIASDTVWLTIIGLGAEGLAGLTQSARDSLQQAHHVFGGARHLAFLPSYPHQQQHPWPRPFDAAYAQILQYRSQPVCVLATGDPLFFGVGSQLAARVPSNELRVIPAPSCISLAAARLGWPIQETTTIPAHGYPLARVHRYLAPQAKLFILSADEQTPSQVAKLLCACGYGDSDMLVLEQLGAPDEAHVQALAHQWPHEHIVAKLNLIAVTCHLSRDRQPLSRRTALPDTAYCHDGQLTKRDQRAVILSRLAPVPGQLLWDVGAGCGSIAIEWLRAEDHNRAIAIERCPDRCRLIEQNCHLLGAPELDIITGQAPDALAQLEAPEAIFIGGGLTTPAVFEQCWQALKPGGRLVASAVTLDSEAFLLARQAQFGGDLIRLAVDQAQPLGRFQAWKPAYPLIIYTVYRSW